MTHQVDLEQNEVRALARAIEWSGKTILEIGCGEGRLARRLSGLGGFVIGIDPIEDLVRSATSAPSSAADPTVRYSVASGERLPFRNETFDRLVFGWSL